MACRLPAGKGRAKAGQRQGKGRAKAGSQCQIHFYFVLS